jgi:hypothetical protein
MLPLTPQILPFCTGTLPPGLLHSAMNTRRSYRIGPAGLVVRPLRPQQGLATHLGHIPAPWGHFITRTASLNFQCLPQVAAIENTLLACAWQCAAGVCIYLAGLQEGTLLPCCCCMPIAILQLGCTCVSRMCPSYEILAW